MSQDENSPSITFAKGIDNRSLDTTLPDGALRVATNVDIDAAGTVRTRQGARLLASGAHHSFYGHPAAGWALLVGNGSLCLLAGDTPVALRSVQSSRMSYAELDGSIYFCNGHDQGRVTFDGALDYWGIATPPPPACAATALGGLRAGIVRVTQTAIAPSGFESGAPAPVSMVVPDGGGVSVTVPTGASFRVYATDVDGEVFRQVGGTWASGSIVPIGVSPRGKPLDSLFAGRPPAGRHLASYRGRLWIADGSTLWFTDAKSPHWVFPENGYFQTDAPITLLDAIEDGLFVGSVERVDFFQGAAPDDMTRRTVWARGAIDGSGLSGFPSDILSDQPIGKSCAWLDSDGVLCIGRPGGQVQPINSDGYQAGAARSASMAYFEHDGLQQLAGVLIDAEAPNAASDAPIVTVHP